MSPSGYTAAIYDAETGDEVTFVDYALGCSRAFGALIMLRDHDQDLESTKRYIREETYAGSMWNRGDLARAETELRRLKAMTDEEVMRKQRAERREAKEAAVQAESRRLELEKRYNAMLVAVRAYEPPTPDHVGFKEFMEQQLVQSLEFDCRPYSWPVPELVDAGVWRTRKLAEVRKRISSVQQRLAEEEAREASRKAWVDALVESLGGAEVLA